MSEEQSKQPTKTAKKAAKTAHKGLTEREGDIVRLLTIYRSRMTVSMLQRKMGKSHVFFPRDMDDIRDIYMISKSFSQIVKLDDMKGFCKIWDEIVEKWPEISKLMDSGNGREMQRYLKKIYTPYASNLATGDYSDSIYG